MVYEQGKIIVVVIAPTIFVGGTAFPVKTVQQTLQINGRLARKSSPDFMEQT